MGKDGTLVTVEFYLPVVTGKIGAYNTYGLYCFITIFTVKVLT